MVGREVQSVGLPQSVGFLALKQSGGRGELHSPSAIMHARHPKVADAASGEEEPRVKVREVADAPASLKSNVSKKLETKYSVMALFFLHI